MKTTLALLLALAAAAPAFAQAPAAPSGDAANGRRIYMAIGCYQCHGTSGEGSERTAPRIAPDPLAFNIFENQLRNPRAQMPVYTPVVLPDQGLADVYAYLKSQPQPKKVADIPLLNR